MRLRTRIHEWLADRISWVQYPDPRTGLLRPRTLVERWDNLSRSGKGWILLFAFWGALILLSIWGNSLP